jgi:tetratricopeptide (TPR) repeat protein
LANIAELLTWQGEPLQARQRAHVAVELARELDYKLGASAAIRAIGVAALDLGLHEEAEPGLHRALALATEIGLSEEVLASLVALTQLALERGQLEEAAAFAARGAALAADRDPERYLPLLWAQWARAVAAVDAGGAATAIADAEAALAETPVPRRTQVMLALAHAHLALGDREAARRSARTVVQTAGSRGFRLLSLEARALMAHLTDGEERATHRAVGQELARDFSGVLAPEMARCFAQRPFLRFLE